MYILSKGYVNFLRASNCAFKWKSSIIQCVHDTDGGYHTLREILGVLTAICTRNCLVYILTAPKAEKVVFTYEIDDILSAYMQRHLFVVMTDTLI